MPNNRRTSRRSFLRAAAGAGLAAAVPASVHPLALALAAVETPAALAPQSTASADADHTGFRLLFAGCDVLAMSGLSGEHEPSEMPAVARQGDTA